MFLEHEYCVYLCSPDKTKEKTNKKTQPTKQKNPLELGRGRVEGNRISKSRRASI